MAKKPASPKGKPGRPAEPLTDRQQRFCEEYLVDLNATQAAIRTGYSEKTARQQGERLLSNADIQAQIQKLQAERSNRTQITADRVLAELALIGFSNVNHYSADDAGRIVLLEGAPEEAVRAVSSVKITSRTSSRGETETKTEIKLWDKVSALDKIGRHLGMFKDKVELTGDAIPIVIMPDNGRGDEPA